MSASAIDDAAVQVPPAPEPFVTRAELAELMRVSTKTVDRLVAQGMPSVTWGRRTRRFQASVAIAWGMGQQREAAV